VKWESLKKHLTAYLLSNIFAQELLSNLVDVDSSWGRLNKELRVRGGPSSTLRTRQD